MKKKPLVFSATGGFFTCLFVYSLIKPLYLLMSGIAADDPYLRPGLYVKNCSGFTPKLTVSRISQAK
jgi:hypothetical protein